MRRQGLGHDRGSSRDQRKENAMLGVFGDGESLDKARGGRSGGGARGGKTKGTQLAQRPVAFVPAKNISPSKPREQSSAPALGARTLDGQIKQATRGAADKFSSLLSIATAGIAIGGRETAGPRLPTDARFLQTLRPVTADGTDPALDVQGQKHAQYRQSVAPITRTPGAMAESVAQLARQGGGGSFALGYLQRFGFQGQLGRYEQGVRTYVRAKQRQGRAGLGARGSEVVDSNVQLERDRDRAGGDEGASARAGGTGTAGLQRQRERDARRKEKRQREARLLWQGQQQQQTQGGRGRGGGGGRERGGGRGGEQQDPNQDVLSAGDSGSESSELSSLPSEGDGDDSDGSIEYDEVGQPVPRVGRGRGRGRGRRSGKTRLVAASETEAGIRWATEGSDMQVEIQGLGGTAGDQGDGGEAGTDVSGSDPRVVGMVATDLRGGGVPRRILLGAAASGSAQFGAALAGADGYSSPEDEEEDHDQAEALASARRAKSVSSGRALAHNLHRLGGQAAIAAGQAMRTAAAAARRSVSLTTDMVRARTARAAAAARVADLDSATELARRLILAGALGANINSESLPPLAPLLSSSSSSWSSSSSSMQAMVGRSSKADQNNSRELTGMGVGHDEDVEMRIGGRVKGQGHGIAVHRVGRDKGDGNDSEASSTRVNQHGIAVLNELSPLMAVASMPASDVERKQGQGQGQDHRTGLGEETAGLEAALGLGAVIAVASRGALMRAVDSVRHCVPGSDASVAGLCSLARCVRTLRVLASRGIVRHGGWGGMGGDVRIEDEERGGDAPDSDIDSDDFDDLVRGRTGRKKMKRGRERGSGVMDVVRWRGAAAVSSIADDAIRPVLSDRLSRMERGQGQGGGEDEKDEESYDLMNDVSLVADAAAWCRAAAAAGLCSPVAARVVLIARLGSACQSVGRRWTQGEGDGGGGGGVDVGVAQWGQGQGQGQVPPALLLEPMCSLARASREGPVPSAVLARSHGLWVPPGDETGREWSQAEARLDAAPEVCEVPLVGAAQCVTLRSRSSSEASNDLATPGWGFIVRGAVRNMWQGIESGLRAGLLQWRPPDASPRHVLAPIAAMPVLGGPEGGMVGAWCVTSVLPSLAEALAGAATRAAASVAHRSGNEDEDYDANHALDKLLIELGEWFRSIGQASAARSYEGPFHRACSLVATTGLWIPFALQCNADFSGVPGVSRASTATAWIRWMHRIAASIPLPLLRLQPSRSWLAAILGSIRHNVHPIAVHSTRDASRFDSWTPADARRTCISVTKHMHAASSIGTGTGTGTNMTDPNGSDNNRMASPSWSNKQPSHVQGTHHHPDTGPGPGPISAQPAPPPGPRLMGGLLGRLGIKEHDIGNMSGTGTGQPVEHYSESKTSSRTQTVDGVAHRADGGGGVTSGGGGLLHHKVGRLVHEWGLDLVPAGVATGGGREARDSHGRVLYAVGHAFVAFERGAVLACRMGVTSGGGVTSGVQPGSDFVPVTVEGLREQALGR